METTARLRRQAELCLRLLHLCPDQPVSGHLSFLAARYHEAALRAEFGVPADCDDDNVTTADSVCH